MTAFGDEKRFQRYLWLYWTILDEYKNGEPSEAADFIRGIARMPLTIHEPGTKGWCSYSPSRSGIWLRPGDGERLADSINKHARPSTPATGSSVRSMLRQDADRAFVARMKRFITPDSATNDFYQDWKNNGFFKVQDVTDEPLGLRLAIEKEQGLTIPEEGLPFLGALFTGRDLKVKGRYWFALGTHNDKGPERPAFLAPLRSGRTITTDEEDAQPDLERRPGQTTGRRPHLFPGVEDVTEETRLPQETIVERFRELETRDPPAGFILKIVVAALDSNLRSCPVELVRHSYETWYEDRPQPARRGEGSAALDRLERDEWVRRNSGEVYSRHIEFPKDVGWRTKVSVDEAVMKALSGELALGYGDTWFFDQWMQWAVGHASGLPRRVARRVLPRGIMLYLKHPDRRATVLRALASIASSRAPTVPWWAELLIDAGDPGNGLAMLEGYAKRRKNVESRVWCHMLRASTTLGQHDTALGALRRLSEEVLKAKTEDDDGRVRSIGWFLLDIGSRAPGDETMASALRSFGSTEPPESVERLAIASREYLDDEDIVRPHLIAGLRERDDVDEATPHPFSPH